jgi:hypothetical protein
MDIYLCLQTGIDGRTGCAVKYRLLGDASIFVSELYVNDVNHQALLRIQESTLHDFVIYSDSLSSLESKNNFIQPGIHC